MIKKKYGQDATNVGDEGGFAPNIQVNNSLMKPKHLTEVTNYSSLFLSHLSTEIIILFVWIQENKEGLELLKTAIEKAGYTGKVSLFFKPKFILQRKFDCNSIEGKLLLFSLQVVIGMDVAASEFYGSDQTYDLNFKEEVSCLLIYALIGCDSVYPTLKFF